VTSALLYILKDKSSAVGPHSIRAMISEGDDVIHVNVGSGITTAHLASLTHGSETTIYAFGIKSDHHKKHILKTLQHHGVKSMAIPFNAELVFYSLLVK